MQPPQPNSNLIGRPYGSVPSRIEASQPSLSPRLTKLRFQLEKRMEIGFNNQKLPFLFTILRLAMNRPSLDP